MNWIKVFAETDLQEGTRHVVKVGNETILLLKNNNQIRAITNKCPHLKLPLAKGTVTDDNAIVCPWHRSAFDLDTGDVKSWSPWPPVVGKLLGCLSKEKALTVFPTKVESGDIWVQLPE